MPISGNPPDTGIFASTPQLALRKTGRIIGVSLTFAADDVMFLDLYPATWRIRAKANFTGSNAGPGFRAQVNFTAAHVITGMDRQFGANSSVWTRRIDRGQTTLPLILTNGNTGRTSAGGDCEIVVTITANGRLQMEIAKESNIGAATTTLEAGSFVEATELE